MEEPVFVKCEAAWTSDTEELSNLEQTPCDYRVKIKEEPDDAHPRLEEVDKPCSEEPSADVKDEISIEECSAPSFEEETDVEKAAVLKQYVVPHPGGWPYSCKDCCKSFPERGRLKEHMVIHSGEKPFVCEQCSQRFSRSCNLKRHKITHSGEKPYCCSQCSKSFSRKGDLSKHQITHSGERPYSCSNCSRSFSNKEILKRHIFIHSGERPHCCTLCDKTFCRKGDLNTHQLTHSRWINPSKRGKPVNLFQKQASKGGKVRDSC